jgi:hypothetical protein
MTPIRAKRRRFLPFSTGKERALCKVKRQDVQIASIIIHYKEYSGSIHTGVGIL